MTESVGDRGRYKYHDRKCAKFLKMCQQVKSLKTVTSQTHIIIPCHSQLFQSNRMPPSSAASSLCSVPVVPALQSRDQTWQCNSRGVGCKRNRVQE